MKFFAGIDGGQSATTAVIADDRGHVLGRGSAGPSDEVWEQARSTRLRDALDGALQAALRSAGLDRTTHFSAVVAGVSGYDGALHGEAPLFNADRFELQHDAPVAHAAALGGKAGVVVIAGTGSVAYGTNAEGESLTVGGWGYLFGDEGSAFWIARRGLERIMHDEDANSVSPLRKPLLQFFERESVRAVARAFYDGTLARADIAQAARVVLSHAGEDEDAAMIAAQAADALALLGATTARRLGGGKRVLKHRPLVAFVGGLMHDHAFAHRVRERLRDRLPEAKAVEPLYEPAIGALLLAYHAAGRKSLPTIQV
ncbi:MAG: hypothetical protein JOZ38_02780 [Candidatus Eremiobacteraeota bacterium]|nr:hypothetical protein [Candidatus Eremiobacteraeota bacterium]